MRVSLLYEAVVFKAFKGRTCFANLSREDPAKLSIYQNGANYIHPVGNSAAPLVFTSVGISGKCNLYEPRMVGTKAVKAINVVIISGESERLVGAIGMILNETEYKAQLYGSELTFSTSYSFGSGQFPICFTLFRTYYYCC